MKKTGMLLLSLTQGFQEGKAILLPKIFTLRVVHNEISIFRKMYRPTAQEYAFLSGSNKARAPPRMVKLGVSF